MKTVFDLTQSIIEGGYNNPAFDDGKVEVCMDYDPVGWHAEIYTAATHVGTHIDAPMHKLEGGRPLSEYPLERFFGKAVFLDMRSLAPDAPINAAMLAAAGDRILPGSILILFTGWPRYRTPGSKSTYIDHSPWLTPDGAKYLVEKGISAVGIDHFSIAGRQPEVDETHSVLMNADILIIEGLAIPDGVLNGSEWSVIALPLKLEGCSGAPARVLAFGE